MIGWMILLPGERKPECPVPVGPWPAILPKDVALQEDVYGIRWNHPASGSRLIDGLNFRAYSGDPLKRQACFWSHFHLWRRCVLDDKPTLILESDAVFTRDFHPAELIRCPFGIVSLNDPMGATRKARVYSDTLQFWHFEGMLLTEAPRVDDPHIPQGLPGMSAYVIWPWFAQELLDKVAQVGAMPNDALANRQWFPGKLGCLTRYATKVSGRKSTLA